MILSRNRKFDVFSLRSSGRREPWERGLLFRMFKNTCQSPDLPLLCYLLVFTDLLSADLLCKLLKRVPGLLGGHITPRSILGRYYTPFPLLPSHPHPSPDLGPGSWPTSSTISFQEMHDFLRHTSLISKTCKLCFLQHTYHALQLTVAEYRSVYRAIPSLPAAPRTSAGRLSNSRTPIFLLAYHSAYQQCVMKVGTSWFLYPAVKRIFLFFFIFVLFHFIFLGRFVFSFSVPMKRFSAMMRHDGNRDYWCFITQKVFQI